MASIVDKIRKAMALAENQAGTPEGETAALIARALMVKHAIEAGDLDEIEDDPIIHRAFYTEKRNVWRRSLVHGLTLHCEVLSLHQSSSNKLDLYGRTSAVEITVYLYEVVVRQVEGALEAHVDRLKGLGVWAVMPPGRKRSERNDFCRSAVWAIRERLTEMRTQEQSASPKTTALMRRQRDEAEDFARAQGREWQSAPSSACWSWSEAGGSAGEAINLNPGVQGGRRPVAFLE